MSQQPGCGVCRQPPQQIDNPQPGQWMSIVRRCRPRQPYPHQSPHWHPGKQRPAAEDQERHGCARPRRDLRLSIVRISVVAGRDVRVEKRTTPPPHQAAPGQSDRQHDQCDCGQPGKRVGPQRCRDHLESQGPAQTQNKRSGGVREVDHEHEVDGRDDRRAQSRPGQGPPDPWRPRSGQSCRVLTKGLQTAVSRPRREHHQGDPLDQSGPDPDQPGPHASRVPVRPDDRIDHAPEAPRPGGVEKTEKPQGKQGRSDDRRCGDRRREHRTAPEPEPGDHAAKRHADHQRSHRDDHRRRHAVPETRPDQRIQGSQRQGKHREPGAGLRPRPDVEDRRGQQRQNGSQENQPQHGGCCPANRSLQHPATRGKISRGAQQSVSS